MKKPIDIFTAVFGSLAQWFLILAFIVFILVMWSAQIRACFGPMKPALSSGPKAVKADSSDKKHRIICERLIKVYTSVDPGGEIRLDPRFIDEEAVLNARSYGKGRFLFWETVADLPEWAIDSVLAHEIAHDIRLHVTKRRDFDDVREFFTEVLSLFGGADHGTERVLQEWSSDLILPRHSQSQEYEADKYAVRILSRCGYDKPGLTYARTLSHIRDKYGDSGGGFFSDHPSIQERIQSVLSGG